MKVKNKLSINQANEIYVEALRDSKNIKGYRLGQAIFNRLPSELADQIRTTQLDFFHETNNELVHNMYYHTLVDLLRLNEEDACE